MFTSLQTDRNFSLFRSLFRAIFVSARGIREDEIVCVESDNDGGKKIHELRYQTIGHLLERVGVKVLLD